MSRYPLLGLNFAILLAALWLQDKVRVWTARRCGDFDAAARQRSVDNPFARVDWIGSVLLPLFLFWRGLPALGWVKPLDLESEKLRQPRRDGVLVALAGPALSLLLVVAGAGVTHGLRAAGLLNSTPLLQVLVSFCSINACLAVFNLLPVPPLAGSAVAELFLEGDALTAFEEIKPFGFLLLLAGAFFNFFDFLTLPVNSLVQAVLGL